MMRLAEGMQMNLAYADPPYPGQSAKHYRDHPDYAGEVDHDALIRRLHDEYDGWILHTSSVALHGVLDILDWYFDPRDWRVMAWVKPFAAFKPNVPVAYAWEPVIVYPAREPTVTGEVVSRDWVSAPITMRRGLHGVKPDAVCYWAFQVVGAMRDDTLDDLYPGSGAVTRAWEKWCRQPSLLGGMT